MLKHAANLSSDNEYFIVWAGETNARPWGSKSDGFSLFPDLELARDGMTLTATLATSTETINITIGSTESIEENEWTGCRFRAGTKTAPVLGYGIVRSNAAIAVGGETGTITVNWSTNPGSGDASCYIVREDPKWANYPQVQILTPYQPVEQEDSPTEATLAYPVRLDKFDDLGRSVTLPAPFSGQTNATLFSDLGVLLPFTFNEGISGWGVSDQADSGAATAHALQSAATSGGNQTWTYATSVGVADHLNGGHVIIDWEDSSVMKRSWAPISDSTSTTFVVVVANWLGDGDPGDATGPPHPKVKRWTAWIPYFDDNPYAYLPGEGYTYPNHDMMPCGNTAIGPNVRNLPRGISGVAYSDAFGSLLVAAMKISAAIGKWINIVNLAATDATLAPANTRNAYGFEGTLGWWDHNDHATWDPSDTASIYARLDKLLRTVLPNAMTAAANTKNLRCLGIVFNHGEADALSVYARQTYGRSQRMFIDTLRRLIDDLGYSPYGSGAKIPYVQPRIAVLPYGIDGTYARDTDRGGSTAVYNADEAGLINTAIEENTSSDEFSATVRVDDLPRLSTDSGIYSGVGEAGLGARIGDALSLLIDHGLGFGSTSLDDAQTRLIDICNLALTHIGDAGQITSLTDGSEQAILCQRLLPEARDELLESAQWGFALRRRQLVAIRTPEARIYQNWDHCYVLPAEAMFSFNLLGPVEEVLTGDFDYTDVLESGYSTTFVDYDGSSLDLEDTTLVPIGLNPGSATGAGGVIMGSSRLLPLLSSVELNPQPFKIEQSPFGHRYIYTNQEQATLQYVARVVDADLYSPLFASALAVNLGARLASVLIKGKEGEAVSKMLLQKTTAYVRSAASSDANQKRSTDRDRPFGFVPDQLRHRFGSSNYDVGSRGNLDYYPSGFRVD